MNVLDIKEFYKTPLGSVMHASIEQLMHEFNIEMGYREEQDQGSALGHGTVGGVPGVVRVGYGYPLPYLDAKHPIPVLMPYQMGATQWPHHSPSQETSQGGGNHPADPARDNHTIMIDEETFPLCDQSVDQLIMIHGFEHALNIDIMLAECYRVLQRDASLVIITPNRRSLWAHSDATPLGHGRPYTMTQLRKKLEASQFHIHSCKRALYPPAYNNDWCISVSRVFEKVCPLFARKFSGLIAIHATKSCLSAQKVFSPLERMSLNKRQHQLNMVNGRVLMDTVS